MNGYSKDERLAMLEKMQEASNRFYMMAFRIGCHPFIEFTGLMNEWIKLCNEAERAGINWLATDIHSQGAALPMKSSHRAYLSEKLECIYGASLDALTRQEADQ